MRLYRTDATSAAQIRFAFQIHAQAFDAVYLALAQALGATLATLDSGMRTAAPYWRAALRSAAIERP